MNLMICDMAATATSTLVLPEKGWQAEAKARGAPHEGCALSSTVQCASPGAATVLNSLHVRRCVTAARLLVSRLDGMGVCTHVVGCALARRGVWCLPRLKHTIVIYYYCGTDSCRRGYVLACLPACLSPCHGKPQQQALFSSLLLSGAGWPVHSGTASSTSSSISASQAH